MIFKIVLTILALVLIVTFVLSLINDTTLLVKILCGVAAGYITIVSICEWSQPKGLEL